MNLDVVTSYADTSAASTIKYHMPSYGVLHTPYVVHAWQPRQIGGKRADAVERSDIIVKLSRRSPPLELAFGEEINLNYSSRPSDS